MRIPAPVRQRRLVRRTFARIAFPLVAVALVSGAAAGRELPPERLFPYDPVALVEGEEVVGEAALEHVHGRFTYRFATAEHRDAFLADPSRYEVKLGGACARMGPLSGEGSPAIHAVHDGRIYVFASTACRKGFLSAAERLLRRADAPPVGTDEERRAGALLVERAVLAIAPDGGPARLDNVRSLELRQDAEVEMEGSRVLESSARLYVFAPGAPDPVRHVDEQRYGDWRHAMVREGDAGFHRAREESYPLHPQQAEELECIAHEDLVVLLRARTRPDFVAFSRGTIERDGERLHRVELAFGGTTMKLDLDDAGLPRRLAFRGRGPSRAFGELEHRFVAYADVGGLRLPTRSEATFDGERAPSLDRALTSVLVDAPSDPARFSPTPWPP